MKNRMIVLLAHRACTEGRLFYLNILPPGDLVSISRHKDFLPRACRREVKGQAQGEVRPRCGLRGQRGLGPSKLGPTSCM